MASSWNHSSHSGTLRRSATRSWPSYTPYDVRAIIERIEHGDFFCIDTNIWLKGDYEPGIEGMLGWLKERRSFIAISAAQREELNKLRHDSRPALASAAATVARRMVNAAKDQVVRYPDPPAHRPDAYLDNNLIRMLRAHLRRANGGMGYGIVVTDDVELTGRIYTLPAEQGRGSEAVTVLTGPEFTAVMRRDKRRIP
ncbi:MAG: hypothetical protein WBR17_40095 [Paraburkholderia sp.]|uniref:hypothetical protein n=1 Tax=Paraburkholderia sp. TaxID=1926495 RepID=UPI003C5246B5